MLGEKYSQGFLELPRGGQKQAKQGVFCGCLVSCFPISSPHGHLSSSHTLLFVNVSFILAFLPLLLCFPSCGGCVFLFLLTSIFAVFFTFHSVVCLCCLLSWCEKNPDQMRNYLTILFSCLCFGACIPTLSLGSTNNPTRPREEPLEMVYFCLVSCSINNVLKYLFLLFFCTSTNFCLQMGPHENDNVLQSAKQKLGVLEMVFLERWKHSCSPKHRT